MVKPAFPGVSPRRGSSLAAPLASFAQLASFTTYFRGAHGNAHNQDTRDNSQFAGCSFLVKGLRRNTLLRQEAVYGVWYDKPCQGRSRTDGRNCSSRSLPATRGPPPLRLWVLDPKAIMRPRGGPLPARGATASAPCLWRAGTAVKAPSVPCQSGSRRPDVDDAESSAPTVRPNARRSTPEAQSKFRSALRAGAPKFESKSTLSAGAPCFTPPLVKFATALFSIPEEDEKLEDPVEKTSTETTEPRPREGPAHPAQPALKGADAIAQACREESLGTRKTADPRGEDSGDSPSRMTRELSEKMSARDVSQTMVQKTWRMAAAATPPGSARTQGLGYERASSGSPIASQGGRAAHQARQAVLPVQARRGAAGRRSRAKQHAHRAATRSAPTSGGRIATVIE